MTAAKHKAIIQEYLSAYNAFDVEAMLSSVHHDVKFQNVSGGEVNAEAKGIDELRKMAEHSRQLFSSRHQAITSYEDQDNIVTVGIRFKATLAVDFPDGGKAGDSLNLEGTSVFEFKDGKLWRITDYS